MTAQGIDPYAFLRQTAGRLDRITDRGELDRLLDDLEYLYEVIDPELQHLAEDMMERIRRRSAELRSARAASSTL